ncbi:unnamed protein product [Vitrella brassicaformis CCMP3155]|uniref:Ion transport domain-containing protein n=1 Tax=Vitrella brassicaformis (strain CCMP3155) TaxID=1169540 RepID=A0A0G4FFC4_VITBC|nr:unnamed protein product [Vitrella brassicaformis CCMP3155]|eukprot:CEM11559.1 unnamed protein product [Vitrella brassicaformis CCMP3155]
MAVMIGCVFAYVNVYEISSSYGDEIQSKGWIWLWAIVTMGGGYIAQEIMQMFRLGWRYWGEYWNYLDLASSLAVISFVALHFSRAPSEAITASLSLVGLLFTTRFLQIATLNSTTGPLILAVIRMLADISIFLLLYVYVLLAFAATEPLDSAIQDEHLLIPILLILYVILLSIILLNLLIAIMAFTWDAIESSQHAHYHMLRLRLLNEYLYMPTYERIPPPFSLISTCGYHKAQQDISCMQAFFC